MSRDERKMTRYKRNEYVNYKKEIVKAKEFVPFDCQCTLLCATKISEEQYRNEYQKF